MAGINCKKALGQFVDVNYYRRFNEK